MNKEIILPEGWSVDKIKDGKIILKESAFELNTWGKCFRKLSVMKKDIAFIDSDGSIIDTSIEGEDDDLDWYNVFPKEYAEPMLALMQLLTCYKAWVGDWKPNWKDLCTTKCGIHVDYNTLQRAWSVTSQCLLVFPTADMRDKFFETFEDLIEQAKPLL